jgi:hypothetical protein
MSNEQIHENAAAAATPASGPPDVRETRRQEIMKQADYWKEGPTTQALRNEMNRLASDPGVVAQQDQRRAEAQTKIAPDERRRQELSKDPKYLAGDPAKVREMRALLQKMSAAEEGAVPLDQVPLEDHRSVFGLAVPEERVLPKGYQEEYEREYSGHEMDFLVAARQHGLDSKLVGELRDVGIQLAIAAEGRPVSDEDWNAATKRFAGRLTQTQATALRTWWRAHVEGGGAA